jgi:G3E family GTPase
MSQKAIPILAPPPRTDPISLPGRSPVPVTLLTGFLGAGKTTLLNRILNGKHLLRVGVLVNDFGAINIDAELVEGVEENVISLTNGCVCCQIRDDLIRSLEQLLGRTDSIDYIILEASGVADPEGIVMTFLDQKYAQLLRLDSITCIIDAEAIFAQGDDERINLLKLRQIGFADMVILNKTDLVSPQHIAVAREWIDHHLNRIRIFETVRCDVPLEILLSAGRFDPAHVLFDLQNNEHACGHSSVDNMFQVWSFESDNPMALDSLRNMVRKELPRNIYRCKGIIYSADNPNKRLTLQVVGRRTEIYGLDTWGKRKPRTQIVAIGSSIDVDAMNKLFKSCLDKPQT